MEKLCHLVGYYGPFIARVLLVVVFVPSGYGKIGAFTATAASMAGKGIPFAEAALVVSIIVELGASAMLIFGWKTRWAATALFLWLIPVTLLYHNFWAVDGAQARGQLVHFEKNLAIMGGMLYVMVFGAGPFSLDQRKR